MSSVLLAAANEPILQYSCLGSNIAFLPVDLAALCQRVQRVAPSVNAAYSHVVQLSIYGRYFVSQFEAKVFAGVLALITSILYFLTAAFVYKSIKENS